MSRIRISEWTDGRGEDAGEKLWMGVQPREVSSGAEGTGVECKDEDGTPLGELVGGVDAGPIRVGRRT